MLIVNWKKLNDKKVDDKWASGFFPDTLKTTNRYFTTEADCYIQFNIYNPYLNNKKNNLYKHILESKKPFLVVEEGAFRQFPNYKRIGWTSYKNGIGNFNNKNVDNSRWKRFCKDTNLSIKDWHSPGDNILIMGQLEGDSSLIEMYDAGYNSFSEYVLEKIYEIRQYTDRPIVIRPHPKTVNSFNSIVEKIKDLKNISISKNFSNDSKDLINGGAGLNRDFKKAYCVVTYSSNSAVESVCKGIPTFALSPTSSAYDVSHNNLSQIENLDYNKKISNWCNSIAYTIWNDDEIKRGLMWKHLKQVII